jgi:hypothetical protein
MFTLHPFRTPSTDWTLNLVCQLTLPRSSFPLPRSVSASSVVGSCPLLATQLRLPQPDFPHSIFQSPHLYDQRISPPAQLAPTSPRPQPRVSSTANQPSAVPFASIPAHATSVLHDTADEQVPERGRKGRPVLNGWASRHWASLSGLVHAGCSWSNHPFKGEAVTSRRKSLPPDTWPCMSCYFQPSSVSLADNRQTGQGMILRRHLFSPVLAWLADI